AIEQRPVAPGRQHLHAHANLIEVGRRPYRTTLLEQRLAERVDRKPNGEKRQLTAVRLVPRSVDAAAALPQPAAKVADGLGFHSEEVTAVDESGEPSPDAGGSRLAERFERCDPLRRFSAHVQSDARTMNAPEIEDAALARHEWPARE